MWAGISVLSETGFQRRADKFWPSRLGKQRKEQAFLKVRFIGIRLLTD